MSPTTATPLSWRSKNHTTAVAPSMPISATGARGKKWLSVSSTASVPRPRVAVGRCAWSRWPSTWRTSSTNDDTFSGIPSSLPSCEAAIVNAMPARYPTSTGLDNRSARAPSRRTQPIRQQTPTISASAAASATRSSPAATSDPSAVAVISAVVDSGPTESWRDDPRKTYTVRPPTAAHRVASGGTPATSAYAITCGIRYAVTVMPASTSPRSHVRS